MNRLILLGALGLCAMTVQRPLLSALLGVPGPATPHHAGPFWSIDYRSAEPDTLVTRRFRSTSDGVRASTYVNGFVDSHDT